MAMDTVLKNLEERIETMVEAFGRVSALEQEQRLKIQSLESKLAELESERDEGAAAAERADELEQQNQRLAERLEQIVESIDKALSRAEGDVDD